MKFVFLPSAAESAGSILTARNYYPKMVEDILHDTDHQEEGFGMGVLANAYTEPKDLKEFYEMNHPQGRLTYADSGGLQVITLGREITPEVKREIFNTQMKYSDYAMSFDEIPVLTEKNEETGFVRRIFVDEWFKTKAQESGRNIAEQIRIFHENDSNSKVLFIIQSADFNTAREWAWFCFQEVKKLETEIPNYQDYVGGLALGNTSSGGLSNLSDFMLRFQHELDFLPEAWRKNLHVLGSGAISRIVVSMVVDDEYWLPGTQITADATTQTRAMIYGNFQYLENGVLVTEAAGRDISESSLNVINRIYNRMKPYLDKYKNEYNLKVNDVKDFQEHYTEYSVTGMRKKTHFEEACKDGLLDECEVDYEYYKRARISRFFWSMFMIQDYLKFLKTIKETCHEYRSANQKRKGEIKKYLKEALPGNLYKPMSQILEISHYNEYMKGETPLTGHPYKIDLTSTGKTGGVIKHKGIWYQTDFYEGKLLGRPLESMTGGQKGSVPGSTLRSTFLSQLTGRVIDQQKLEKEPTMEIDVW